MTIDKRALREVAEKATPGNWRLTSSRFNGITVTPFSLCGEEVTLAHTVEKRDAEFIAAASPRTMLALLDELEHYKSREERVTKLVLDNSTSWDVLYEKLEAAERSIAEQSAIVAAAEKLVRCKGRYHSELNYRALAKLFGVITPDLPPLVHENVHYADAAEVEITALRQRIQELEAKLETADRLQDSAFRDGLKTGFSYGQTDDQSGFAQCMSAYSNAGIGVKQQEDSVDSDVGRNQPGMVVAVHIDAGDFVKVKGQVFEVEETDFDDHDVTLWFVGGNALKCAAGCQVEVVSAPVAAGIKVKGE
ncbi:ead/Ea22-like family protein [Salmonella enterica subsp. enterica serovar Berta]|nr:ead/Ea22-like family protein [Salmonella enterica subsp. enterica serovar Berta]